MSDVTVRVTALGLLALALVAMVPGTPAEIRVGLVAAFALTAPGLAASRFIPSENWIDRLALTGALSLSLIALVSLLLVTLGRWTGGLALAELACVTTALAAFPAPRFDPPATERVVDDLGGETPTDHGEAVEPEPVPRAVPAISVPPRPLTAATQPARPETADTAPTAEASATESTSDRPLAAIHRRARSDDPVERRAGLIELAHVLEVQGEAAWADELRALADDVLQSG